MMIPWRRVRNDFLGVAVVSAMGVNCAWAAAADGVKSPTDVSLAVTGDRDSKWQLEVRQMPLLKVLAAIENKTGIPIHYSVLPEGRITATCVGPSLKPVLECLLNHKADLIVRYARGASGKVGEPVAEVWVLGASLDGDGKESATCIADNDASGLMELKQSGQTAEADLTDDLLAQAKSARAEERADAIGALLGAGRKDDPRVKAALEEALNDADAGVRAQAVSTLAHREGGGASAAIRGALQDPASDVRMMAVDGITDDVALLQQAVNDSDETVRELAAIKLEELMQRNRQSP